MNNNKKNINDRRNTNPVNSVISPPSEKKLVNNYFSEKNESSKSKGCICQSRPEEALIKNGICRLCERTVDMNTNNYHSNQNQQITYLDNIINKKRGYENDLNSLNKKNQ